MAKRKKKSLTLKEDFINEMIKDAIENTQEFDVGLISNGSYDFHDFISYLKVTEQYHLFIEWKESMANVDFSIPEYTIQTIKEDDLPFAEKEYKK
jgi:methionine synthase II (cobalamin-independent)